jgi:hypothetical protein
MPGGCSGHEAVELFNVIGMGQTGQARPEQPAVLAGHQALDRRAHVVDRAHGVDGHDQVRRIADQPPESGLGRSAGPIEIGCVADGDQLPDDDQATQRQASGYDYHEMGPENYDKEE